MLGLALALTLITTPPRDHRPTPPTPVPVVRFTWHF